MKYDILGKYGDVEIFVVEGVIVVMCYIFDLLMVNEFLKKGDIIVLMILIFIFYFEIFNFFCYDFKVVNINVNEVDEKGVYIW